MSSTSNMIDNSLIDSVGGSIVLPESSHHFDPNLPNEKYTPASFDPKVLRTERQKNNNDLAYKSIKEGKIKNVKSINIHAIERILETFQTQKNMSEKDFIQKCSQDDDFCLLLSTSVSKLASRQGVNDEIKQIQIINKISEPRGIKFDKLNNDDFRPCKYSAEVYTKKDVKEKKIPKNDCLKSFDGQITGLLKGWITCKIAMINGGHQDNVFEELHTFCDWVVRFGNKSDTLFIVCIDTDLEKKIQELKEKYKDYGEFLLIGNHIEIQQYFIDHYPLLEPSK